MTTSTSLDDPAVQDLLAEGRSLGRSRLSARELRVELVVGLAFLVATGLLIWLAAPAAPDAGTALVLVACYAALSRIQFEISAATALPVELALVPMLLLLDPAWTPPLVAAALLLGGVPDYLRGTIPVDRALIRLGNAWHALGPAAVLVLLAEPDPSLAQWPVYLLALGVQLAVDLAATSIRDWTELGIRPRQQFPMFATVVLVDAALAPLGLALALVAQERPYAFLLGIPLVALLWHFGRERTANVDQALELSSAYRGTAMLLGDVIEADDSYTGEHSKSVVELVLAVCGRLGLDARETRRAEFTALLHDVGKIAIPKSILHKPGPLTDEEWAVMKTHTVEGERMLHRVGGLLGEVGTLVRSSHERWDGGGYPDGLTGEEIPLGSRIVCACDAFNAMTTTRPYRQARTVGAALEEMVACSGSQFDPAVVAALAGVVAASGDPKPESCPLRKAA